MMELAPTIRLDTPGLETADAVSLQSLFYRGTIEGPLGRFMLQQHFQNQTEKPLEIVYTFPLNSNMLITGFLLKVNGQTLHSEVKKLEDAQEDYEKAIFEGNTAAYLQHHRKNIFSMNIGNLDAGEDLLVQMNLLQLLAVHGKQMRILLPTVVGPRYIPGEAAGERTGFGWGRPTRQVPDADWITPPVSESGVPYRISFQIEITDNQNISVIDSPSHKIRVRRSVDTTIVESVSDDRANRDIVLNLEFDQYPTNKAWIGQSNSTSLMLYWANHQPENVPPRAPADYLFLVDKSGSMADEKLEIVKRALRLCLRKLCPGDGFNLIAFDNHYFAWQSRFYDIREESMSDADLWIQKLRASGGTEILDALRFGLSIPADSKRQKVLVLLTDGQVGNEAEIEALLDKANEQLKVLLFGIDTAVNQELFERIIAKVPGFVEYIYPGEPLEAKVNLQFERLFLPILESIQVADNGLEIESILPEQPQSLHPQDAIPYLMSFKGKVPESLLFRYKLNEGDPVEKQVKAEHASVEMVEAMAKFRAHFLIEHYKARLDQAQIANNLRNEQRLRKKIEALALEYQLESAFTAWTAILQREEKIDDLPHIQIIPSELPATWQWAPQLNRVFKAECAADMLIQKEANIQSYKNGQGIDDFLFDLFMEQLPDGSLALKALPNIPTWRATLLSLVALTNHAYHNGEMLKPFRTNLTRAVDFILKHIFSLEEKDWLLMGYILKMLAELGIAIDLESRNQLQPYLHMINSQRVKDARKSISGLIIEKFDKTAWQLFRDQIEHAIQKNNAAANE